MKQLTVNIPDKEYDFFIQLLKKFDFVKVKEAEFEIPESHKQLVRERIKTAKPEDYIDWDIAEKKIKS
jgi:hypothetical protein